jgi:hypothetical protein
LDNIFDKCETIEDLRSGMRPAAYRDLFDKEIDQSAYTQIRNEGVGRPPLVRFLGTGWRSKIEEALVALAEDSARAQAERLRRRQEREAAKAEAARQEAARQEQLRVEAEERARKEAEEEAGTWKGARPFALVGLGLLGPERKQFHTGAVGN